MNSSTSSVSLNAVAAKLRVKKSRGDISGDIKQQSPGRAKLRSWLHSLMTVVLSDGRTLVGTFVCTDRDSNIILSSCTEHLPHTHTDGEEEARMLGLAMVPGRHVVSMSIDQRHQKVMTEENQAEGGVNKVGLPLSTPQMLDPPLEYI